VKPKLSDLNGLPVGVILPPCGETQLLVKQLQRIRCRPITIWPIPEQLPQELRVTLITVEAEYRYPLSRLAESIHPLSPPLIAVVGYEDPSTLQLVLEMRTAAVLERPVKPFGLLTNLMIALAHWQQRADCFTERKQIKRQQTTRNQIAIAESLLVRQTGIEPDQAHRSLQKMAMNTRRSMEKVAQEIIADYTQPTKNPVTKQNGTNPDYQSKGNHK
jgi:AmiR/NasT family two-component response regulator